MAVIVFEVEGKTETLDLPIKTREISLKGKGITSIDTESFTNFSMLTVLDLRFNKIREFDLKGLRECKNLKHLSLQGNDLSEIDLSPLSEMKSLQWLSLTDNNISELDLQPLSHCEYLSYLFLGGTNPIDLLDLNPIKSNLIELDINFNEPKPTPFDLTQIVYCDELKFIGLPRNRKLTINPIGEKYYRDFEGFKDLFFKTSGLSARDIIPYEEYLKMIQQEHGTKLLAEILQSLLDNIPLEIYIEGKQLLLDCLGMKSLGFFELDIPELLRPLWENSVDIENAMTYTPFLQNIINHIEGGMSTIGLDVEALDTSDATIAKLAAVILDSRKREMEQVRIVMNRSADWFDCKDVWTTAHGFEILSALRFGFNLDNRKYSVLTKHLNDIDLEIGVVDYSDYNPERIGMCKISERLDKFINMIASYNDRYHY